MEEDLTLIAEIHNRALEQVVYISDCLVTTSDRTLKGADFCPFLWKSDVGRMTRGSELISKAVTGNGKLILNAGSFNNIEKVARRFIDVNIDNTTEWQNFLDGFYADRQNEEGYIYAAPVGEGAAHSDSYCNRFERGEFYVCYQGSGSKCLEKVFQKVDFENSGNCYVVAAQILAQLFIMEFTRKGICDEYFGGAYEIFAFGESGFERIPYAILEANGVTSKREDGMIDIDMRPSRVISSYGYERGSVFDLFDLEEGGRVRENSQIYIGEYDVEKNFRASLEKIGGTVSAINLAICRTSDNIFFKFLNYSVVEYFLDGKKLTSKLNIKGIMD